MKHLFRFLIFILLVSCESKVEKLVSLSDESSTTPPLTIPYDGIRGAAPETKRENIQFSPKNLCVCHKRRPINISFNCEQKCLNSENSIGAILYFDLEGKESLDDSIFKDLAGFCSGLPHETSIHRCNINIKDSFGYNQIHPFEPTPGQTSFSLNVSHLTFNETYRLNIEETTSGTKSFTSQFRINYNHHRATRFLTRNIFYLENLNSSGSLYLFNHNDPFYFDLDANQKLDLYDMIEADLYYRGVELNKDLDLDINVSIIHPLSKNSMIVGKMKKPFFDPDDFYSYCIDKNHGYSNNITHQVLFEYFAETERAFLFKEKDSCHAIIQGEAQIKDGLFHVENGVNKLASLNSSFFLDKFIHFPIDPESPLIKKQDQKTYKLMSYEEYLYSCSHTNDENVTLLNISSRARIPLPDKTIGCLPVVY